MRINQIITEAKIDSDLIDRYTRSGYDFISTGYDQAAFIHPKTGWVIKIFGLPERASSYSGLSKGQRSLLDFAKYCSKNPDNPFLPRFKNPKVFKFKNKTYLKITMERLFDRQNAHDDHDWGVFLDTLVQEIVNNRLMNFSQFKEYILNLIDTKQGIEERTAREVLSHMGEQGLEIFFNTVRDLKQMARSNGYLLDLHYRNFMHSSDGDIVIADPFHSID